MKINTAKNIEKDLRNMIKVEKENKVDWSKIKAFSDLYSDAFRQIIKKAN